MDDLTAGAQAYNLSILFSMNLRIRILLNSEKRFAVFRTVNVRLLDYNLNSTQEVLFYQMM